MGIAYNSSIVRDGLVLHLDAANVKSYPGSGTTWSDLSGNGNHGALVNGPIFSNLNKGMISVDSSDDYVQVNNRNTNLEFQPTDAFTVSVVCKSPPYNSSGAIIANMISESPYSGYDLWINTSSQLAMHLISSWSSNAIKVGISYDWAANSGNNVNFCYTYDGSSPTTNTNELNSVDFYINGELEESGKQTLSSTGEFNSTNEIISYNSDQRFRIGSRGLNTVGKAQGTSVDVYSVQVYNRALTAAEVRQNFESMRGRYGI